MRLEDSVNLSQRFSQFFIIIARILFLIYFLFPHKVQIEYFCFKFRFPLVKRLVSPVIEPEDSTLPIITQPALDIIDNHQYNDVPCIYGHTADEGNLIDVSRLLATTDSWECNGFLPFHMNLDLESQLARKLGEKIKQKYFTGGEINKNDLQRVSCSYHVLV